MCVYHLGASIYYLFAVNALRNLGISDEGTLPAQLLVIHFGSCALFFGVFIMSFGNSLAGRLVAMLACLGVIAIYLWWYFEKYSYLRIIELKESSAGDDSELIRIGYFRGALTIDYWILVPTMLLIVTTLVWAGSYAFEKRNREIERR